MDIFRILLYTVHGLVSVGLVVLVVSQTSRHEGLGAVGGSSAPQQRGRAGMEEQLAEYTKFTAMAFMVLSLLLYFCAMKFHWV